MSLKVNRRCRWITVSVTVMYASTVKMICLKSSFESVWADGTTNSSRDVVPDSRSQDCEGMSVTVPGGVRPMQDGLEVFNTYRCDFWQCRCSSKSLTARTKNKNIIILTWRCSTRCYLLNGTDNNSEWQNVLYACRCCDGQTVVQWYFNPWHPSFGTTPIQLSVLHDPRFEIWSFDSQENH